MVAMLYLLAPISLVLLNPIGFLLSWACTSRTRGGRSGRRRSGAC